MTQLPSDCFSSTEKKQQQILRLLMYDLWPSKIKP